MPMSKLVKKRFIRHFVAKNVLMMKIYDKFAATIAYLDGSRSPVSTCARKGPLSIFKYGSIALLYARKTSERGFKESINRTTNVTMFHPFAMKVFATDVWASLGLNRDGTI